MTTRLATPDDARRLAALHTSRITEGFLPTLGPDLLTRLYRRIARSPRAFAFVDEDATGVTGYCACAEDVGALYKEFLLRDGVVAGLHAAPQLARSWRRVLETLRYPAAEGDTALPGAEVLAVAVDPSAAGRGIGRTLVDASLGELARRGTTAVKVVAGADNGGALALYRACGFVTAATIHVHEGVASEVLVWRSS